MRHITSTHEALDVGLTSTYPPTQMAQRSICDPKRHRPLLLFHYQILWGPLLSLPGSWHYKMGIYISWLALQGYLFTLTAYACMCIYTSVVEAWGHPHEGHAPPLVQGLSLAWSSPLGPGIKYSNSLYYYSENIMSMPQKASKSSSWVASWHSLHTKPLK